MLSPANSSTSFNDCERGLIDKLTKHELIVKGMTCAACVCTIECTLKSSIDPSILKSVKIDLLQQSVTVEIIQNPIINLESVISFIRKAGFTVVGSSSDWRCKLETRKLCEMRTFRELRERFFKVLFFSIPVIICMHYNWIFSLAFSIPLHLYAAFDIYKMALVGFNMERLISINCLASLLYSIALTEQHAMFDCAAFVLILFTGGKLIECFLKRKITSSSDGSDLLISLPKTVKCNGVEVNANDLTVGHVIDLMSGDVIPFDGEILDSSFIFVNESTLTGEPLPKRKQSGDHVLAGTRVENGNATMKIIRSHENSFINRLARGVYEPLINENEDGDCSNLADEIAKWFIPVILLLSLLTFLIWSFVFWFSGAVPRDLISEWRNIKRFPSTPVAAAIYFSLTVLCVACPCALAIASPIAVLISKSVGLRRGFLIRDPHSFMDATDIDILLFDKTGTITNGKPRIECEEFEGIYQYDWIYEAIRILESKVLEEQEHPIARSIHQYCQQRKRTHLFFNLIAKNVCVIPGHGVKSIILNEIDNTENLIEISKSVENAKHCSSSDVFIDGVPIVKFSWFDELKSESLDVIYFFKSKYKLGIVSGDSQSSTERTASYFLPGTFTYVFGDCKPEDKSRIVTDLKSQGNRVAFCGDGVNDSMAMTRADFSISLDPSASFASVTLIRKNFDVLTGVFRSARALKRQIWMNMAWAIVYNMICVPVAMGALIPIGLAPIGPEIGTALMSMSGITILLTSLIFQ